MRTAIVCLVLCVLHNAGYGQDAIPCVGGNCVPPAGARVFIGQNHSSKWYTVDSSPGNAYCTEPVAMVYQPRQRRFALFQRRTQRFEAFQNVTPANPLPVDAQPDAVASALQHEELPPPVEAKGKPQPKQLANDFYTGALPTGVDSSQLSASPSYIHNGKPSSKYGVVEAFANTFADQSSKRRITFIGNERDCENAMQKLPSGVDEWAVVKSFSPDDWYIKRNNFVTTGTPVMYIQEPDGTVIHRQDDANGVQTAVDNAKNYNPKLDGDLRKIPSLLGGSMFSFGWLFYVAVGFAAGAVTWPIVKGMWNTLNAGNVAAREAQAKKDALILEALTRLSNQSGAPTQTVVGS